MLARGLRLSYDYLGMVLVGSTLYFFVGLAPAAVTLTAALRAPSLLTLLPLLAVFALLTVPGFTALLGVCRQLVRGEEVPVLRGLWEAFRAHFARSARLALVGGVLLVVLVADLLFFLQAPSAVLRVLAGLWVWLILFALAVLLMAPAVLVWLGSGGWLLLRQAALIVLDNLVVTGAVGLALLALAAISTLLGAPLLLLFGGMSAFVLTAAMEAIVERYRWVQSTREGGKAGEDL